MHISASCETAILSVISKYLNEFDQKNDRRIN